MTMNIMPEMQVHWTTIFTDRLSDTVKLVGPTISCEGAVFTIDSIHPPACHAPRLEILYRRSVAQSYGHQQRVVCGFQRVLWRLLINSSVSSLLCGRWQGSSSNQVIWHACSHHRWHTPCNNEVE